MNQKDVRSGRQKPSRHLKQGQNYMKQTLISIAVYTAMSKEWMPIWLV